VVLGRLLRPIMTRKNAWGTGLVGCLFFGLFFLYIWQCLDPQLLYHADKVVIGSDRFITFPFVLPGMGLFWEYFARPGGMAEYVAAWASQCYFYTYLGALILTTIPCLVFLGTVGLTKGMDVPRRWFLCYVSPLALLVAFNTYVFRLSDYVALVAVIVAVNIYLLSANHFRWAGVCVAVFTVLSLALFHGTGSVYLVFAVLCGLFELTKKRRQTLGAFYLLAALGVPILGHFVFTVFQPGGWLRLSWLELVSSSLRVPTPSAVYLVFVATVAFWPSGTERANSGILSRLPVITFHGDTRLRSVLAVIVLMVVSPLIALGTLDREARSLLRVNYFARLGMWPEVLGELAEHPPREYAPGLLYDINRALFETGQLGDRMFSFPQYPDFLLQVGPDAIPHRGCHETLLALGCINEVERTAQGALEVTGERPYILRELAIVNIVKERPNAATVFLNVLSRDMVHGQWARDYLDLLAQDAGLSYDPQVVHLRTLMVRDDKILTSNEEMLMALLMHNNQNRMAFEYLMAYYLLTGQLDKIAQNISALEHFGYERIPEHYAEALLLESQMTGQPLQLFGWTIEADVQSRFRKFVTLTSGPVSDPDAVAAVAAGTYYDYFFRMRNSQ
jgi:Family of unknown function (DUF6057)